MRRRPRLVTLAVGSIGSVTGCRGLSGSIEQRSFAICHAECDWAAKTPEAGEDLEPSETETAS
ncbi:hypothetical protein [Halolamina sp.]|jgi:hypothetical protein|uniref:hypothetical protein n=1 Tax=Halolamina sp. TaxID=1940283 RepID=UPI000223B4ED|nr:hypothetical protein Halar_1013 [halophilic archaeon DL31]